MSKKAKIILALIGGALCGAAIPAAVIWSEQAALIAIVAGAVATITATITGITVTKQDE